MSKATEEMLDITLERNKISIAEDMIRDNMPLELVVKYSRLSVEKVLEIISRVDIGGPQ